MKEVNKFKNLKFKISNHSEIEEALNLLKILGYSECESGFSIPGAVKHNGICAWVNGEITGGWLGNYEFEQVTLEDLKEMVGETIRCDSTLSNNFTVAWEQVFGEKFIDSVYKAVKQNKVKTVKNDKFTLNRLLGCEVLFENRKLFIEDIVNSYSVEVGNKNYQDCARVSDLTFFTEDGDELTFDEYVQLYYPKG